MSSLTIFVPCKQRGASLLEFAIAVFVVGILTAVLLNRIAYYQEQAEQAAVNATLSNLRFSLEMKVANRKLSRTNDDLTVLTEENPLNLLKIKPANYAGELFSPTDKDIGPGNWCFDRTDKSLIYLLNYAESFRDAPSKRLKFKVKLQRLPHSPAKPSGTPETIGVALEQVKD